MVLYRSPEQTDLHIYCEVSAKFTALGFLYKLYSTNHPQPSTTPPAMFFLQILTTWTES